MSPTPISRKICSKERGKFNISGKIQVVFSCCKICTQMARIRCHNKQHHPSPVQINVLYYASFAVLGIEKNALIPLPYKIADRLIAQV